MDEVLFIGMSSKTITGKHATAFAAHGPRWAKPQRSISAADSILGRQINGLWHGALRQAHGNQQTAHGKDGIGNGKRQQERAVVDFHGASPTINAQATAG